MATRIKDGMIPYTGGQGIEITNNHVINVLLRKFNNLIQVNGDRELYVDLQLPEGIQPDDDFPVGVTTGKILAEDGWYQSGIILNWKTTSGDYIRFIYANDGKLYYDPGTGVWIEFGTGGGGVQINVATASTLGIIKLGTDTKQTIVAELPSTEAGRTYPVQLNADNQAVVNIPWTDTTYTAGNNITIDQNNEISATIPNVLVYKGTVNDLSDLPSSGQSIGDTYFVEGEDGMYSWNGTIWEYVGGTGIDTSNFFDKTVDTSDDITQGTTNLFVTQQEKNTWNNKQDPISAGDGIDITNNVVKNTLPFDPDNAGSLGQFLKKTNDGYAWADIPGGGGGGGSSYTAGDGIDITNNVISNTAMFNPLNQGRTGQVLKKSGTNTYYWADESGGGGGGDSNVKLFTLESTTDTATMQEAIDWLNDGNMPIIKCRATYGFQQITGDYYFYPVQDSTSTETNLIFQAIPTSNNSYILPSGKVRRYRPIIRVELDTNGDVSNITVTTAEAEREDITRTWAGTQSEFDQLGTYENGVIYNILPNS